MPVLDQVTSFLLAVAVIIGICRLLGALCVRLWQPPVVGELAGVLLLGPSLLGTLAPGAYHAVFTPGVLSAIDLIGQFGLVVFMFLLGSKLRVDRLTGNRTKVGLVVTGSITVPFAAGLGFAALVPRWFAPPGVSLPIYLVFFGLAVSVTALPVLARILTDHRVETSETGTLTLTVAAIGDGLAWGVLTVLLAAAGAHDTMQLIVRAALAIVLIVVAFTVVRPALAALSRRIGVRASDSATLAVLVAGATAFAAMTEAVGLHPIVGAFLFGVIQPREHPVLMRVNAWLNDFAAAILLPLFFAGIGLKANFTAFGDSVGWLLLAGTLVVAVVSKFLGAAGGAALAGTGRGQALRIGALMNCRGITELVIANVGLQQGMLTTLGYTIVVLVAIVTTAVTGPLARLWRSDEDLLPADLSTSSPAAVSARQS
ncbi:MAG TPA: cation:proton antiporter [Amycolatopsis sp.]|uniref:cation:proton antiporter n=1 Tax=Amycolatopsis sp. TaxID=37632 RepID=UPI002B468A3C|nr:cation:proton antiporter [Amycolatopsis sp.]HKS47050.1 cation:proton antiporter [Amycolatopsis sp.]